MVEPCGDFDLAEETRRPYGGGQLGVEHLKRDRTAMFQVVREIDRGHSAPAELALKPVTFGQSSLETISAVGQQLGLQEVLSG
jgi:hypothetical protein